jgi:uncharacterized protein YndB with AHSA1/START domain
MNEPALKPDTQDIVVDEVFPHAPETIWKTLTTASLMGRWLMMPAGFEPVEGKHFTYQTKPAGAWDGTIHCEVLEVKPNERLAYAWQGGHEENIENGTRLRLIHSGFVRPTNDAAFKTMGEGWKKVVQTIGAIADGKD